MNQFFSKFFQSLIMIFLCTGILTPSFLPSELQAMPSPKHNTPQKPEFSGETSSSKPFRLVQAIENSEFPLLSPIRFTLRTWKANWLSKVALSMSAVVLINGIWTVRDVTVHRAAHRNDNIHIQQIYDETGTINISGNEEFDLVSGIFNGLVTNIELTNANGNLIGNADHNPTYWGRRGINFWVGGERSSYSWVKKYSNHDTIIVKKDGVQIARLVYAPIKSMVKKFTKRDHDRNAYFIYLNDPTTSWSGFLKKKKPMAISYRDKSGPFKGKVMLRIVSFKNPEIEYGSILIEPNGTWRLDKTTAKLNPEGIQAGLNLDILVHAASQYSEHRNSGN